MAMVTVELPFRLVHRLVQDYSKANPGFCPASEGAPDFVIAEALDFALINEEHWCHDTQHTLAVPTPVRF